MEPSRCAAPRWWPAVSFGSTKRAPTRPKLCSRSFSREMVRDTLDFAPIVANVAAHPVDPIIFKISPTPPAFSALQAKALGTRPASARRGTPRPGTPRPGTPGTPTRGPTRGPPRPSPCPRPRSSSGPSPSQPPPGGTPPSTTTPGRVRPRTRRRRLGSASPPSATPPRWCSWARTYRRNSARRS